VAVGKEEVKSLADLYRRIWARGAAGVDVPLTVLQGDEVRQVSVRSIDRVEYFRERRSY
jgi:serine protease Do